ncbi:hypothetical protein B0H10DRAFT_1951449 [Mycena sp. CBHHK59/15]|nr:hypothetical protein B0H10DRAFT_1951449 [Mycena sp. CBHHK59/15]
MSANSDRGPGFVERAKETAHMWKRLAEQCRAHLTLAGYKFALESDFNLIAYIEQERGKSDNLLREQGIVPRDKHVEAQTFAVFRVNGWKPHRFNPAHREVDTTAQAFTIGSLACVEIVAKNIQGTVEKVQAELSTVSLALDKSNTLYCDFVIPT